MDKATKDFLNRLRCPICAGQIDMFDGKNSKPFTRVNYACAANSRHYGIILINDFGPSIREEYVYLYDGPHMYQVQQIHYGPPLGSTTDIFMYDVNGDNNVIETAKLKNMKLSFRKALFNFNTTNREKLLNRIKTILVFQ